MGRQQITICTSAMCRPELLRVTYGSFIEQCQDLDSVNISVLLNVDPLPSKRDPLAVISTAESFFDSVVSNVPHKPNFSNAVDWLWTNAKTPFIFHLEDDWRFVRPFHLQDMLQHFRDDKQVYQVRMKKRSGNGSRKIVSLAPSVVHESCFKTMAGKFSSDMCPETSLHEAVGGILKSYKYNCVIYGSKSMVVDTGRAWAAKAGVARPKLKRDFVSWVDIKTGKRLDR